MKLLLAVMLTIAPLLGGCSSSAPAQAPAPRAAAPFTPTRTPTPVFSSSPAAASTPSALADTTPPSIRLVEVQSISPNYMNIYWWTNEPATSQVEYGPRPEYGFITPLDESLTINHSVTLEGLSPYTLYHFRVRSKDAAGNEAISEDVVQLTLPYIN